MASPASETTPLELVIFHDDSRFAHDSIDLLAGFPFLTIKESLGLPATIAATKNKLKKRRPTVIIGREVPSQVKELATSSHLLLITQAELSEQMLNDWQGDVLMGDCSPALIRKRLSLWCASHRVENQLASFEESLSWYMQRIEREHELIEHIFRNAMSRNYLDYPHIRTLLAPAEKFNGDLCLVAPSPTGSLYVMMADFTGHGLAPATGALPVSQAFFAMSERNVSIAEMVTEFNFRLSRLLPDNMFCACFLMELSANGERITYWNGGMPPALVFGSDGEIKHRLTAKHMALGIVPTADFESDVTTLKVGSGDSIALYTDGVIELLSQQREFLGLDALEDLLRRYPERKRFTDLLSELEHFRGEEPLRDDLSLAILECRETGLEPHREESNRDIFPFHFSTTLSRRELQQTDVVSTLVSALGRLPPLTAHRTTIYLLLAEVFNNALEHGLLGLESAIKAQDQGFETYYELRQEKLSQLEDGQITIQLTYFSEANQLQFEVENNGAAWRFSSEAIDAEATDDEQAYGRGLALLMQLADNLEWSSDGRKVRFRYDLSQLG
ncbi:serine/threonine-protein phosphatase [Pseudidiomarina homiensis]|uniref:serine/threonine-protein phosphatase n=1 Tax=Pseudidiomarina homiensis TaxID=364198 RepID=UPI00215B3146|nr:serine/threonine-protein phosphatase [Pseudidiomarina homiensis]